MSLDIITTVYAATIAAGGVVGYVRKGSVPSLAMGLACGTLMMVGAFQQGEDEKNVILSLVTSAVLTGVMGYRFANSGKFIPAGLVAVLSLFMMLRLGYKAFND